MSYGAPPLVLAVLFAANCFVTAELQCDYLRRAIVNRTYVFSGPAHLCESLGARRSSSARGPIVAGETVIFLSSLYLFTSKERHGHPIEHDVLKPNATFGSVTAAPLSELTIDHRGHVQATTELPLRVQELPQYDSLNAEEAKPWMRRQRPVSIGHPRSRQFGRATSQSPILTADITTKQAHVTLPLSLDADVPGAFIVQSPASTTGVFVTSLAPDAGTTGASTAGDVSTSVAPATTPAPAGGGVNGEYLYFSIVAIILLVIVIAIMTANWPGRLQARLQPNARLISSSFRRAGSSSRKLTADGSSSSGTGELGQPKLPSASAPSTSRYGTRRKEREEKAATLASKKDEDVHF